MAIKTYLKVSAIWKEAKKIYVNVSGSWKSVRKIWANVSGTWEQVFGSPDIPAGAIVLFTGGTTPTGWTDISSATGTRFIMGSGTTYLWPVVGGSDTVALSGTTTNIGSHGATNPEEGRAWAFGINAGSCYPTKRGTEFLSCGGHEHTHSKTVTLTPQYQNYKLIQNDAVTAHLPIGAILLSEATLDGSWGLSQITAPERLVRVNTASGGTGGVVETSATADTVVTSSNGSHGHHAGPLIITVPDTENYCYEANVSAPLAQYAGSHSHTLSYIYTRDLAKYKLCGWDSTTIAGVVPNSIIMYDSGTAPTGWAMCDGTNGTPDMRDKMLYLSSLANAGSSGTDSLTVTYSTDSQGAHQHEGADETGGDIYGINNDLWHKTVKNAHTHTGSVSSTFTQPEFKAIYFIMYVGA